MFSVSYLSNSQFIVISTGFVKSSLRIFILSGIEIAHSNDIETGGRCRFKIELKGKP